MKIEIKGKKLKEGVRYHGVISDYKQIESRLIISVRFNTDPETIYIKSIQINESVNSSFARFAEDLDIIDEEGNADTDYLDGMHIIANLQRGYDGCLYIDRMIIDDKYYDTLVDDKKKETEKG